MADGTPSITRHASYDQHRADGPLLDDAPPSSKDDRRFLNDLQSVLAGRRPFASRIRIRSDGGSEYLVDGLNRTVTAGPGHAEVQIDISHREIERLMQDEIDPRYSIVFGGMKVANGEVAKAIAFGDFLTGRPFSQQFAAKRALPRPTRDLAVARLDLDEFGYCLIADALSPGQVAALLERSIEQAAAEEKLRPELAAEPVRRVWNLINKGEVFQALLDHSLIDAFVTPMLGEKFLLSSYSTHIAMPGSNASLMHYDEIFVQPRIRHYPVGLNILWFLDDFTEANGATRVMPGSHTAPVAPANPFKLDDTIAATGPSGTALMIDSRLWHSVGHNHSDRSRAATVTYFNRSFMRTQENYALSLRPDIHAQLSDRIRTMLGLRCTDSLGGVEGPVEGQFVWRPENPVGELRPRHRSDPRR
jgi:ectoine hydroxylase-related dioxygenase (phytanoyl-CoA dioxygenase family)